MLKWSSNRLSNIFPYLAGRGLSPSTFLFAANGKSIEKLWKKTSALYLTFPKATTTQWVYLLSQDSYLNFNLKNFFLIKKVTIFSEGTRFTPEKHAESMKVAREKGLPELKYHLLPRTKGFFLAASSIEGKSIK